MGVLHLSSIGAQHKITNSDGFGHYPGSDLMLFYLLSMSTVRDHKEREYWMTVVKKGSQ